MTSKTTITPRQIAGRCLVAMNYQGELPPAVKLIADEDLLSAEASFDGSCEGSDYLWACALELAEAGKFSPESIDELIRIPSD